MAAIDLFTDEQIAAIITSPLDWGKFCVLIENKQKELIPFDPNILQERMSAVYETMQALKAPCKMIGLKPRQSGGSTFGTMIVAHHCKTHKSNGVFMADDYGNSANLYKIAQRHIETDAFPWGIKSKFANKEISFSNGSTLQQDTANNPKAGISSTRQVVHLSEVAKYPSSGVRDSYTTISNMMAALNKEGDNSVAILESTPDQPSGYFYDAWCKSVTLDQWVDGNKGNGWVQVFAAWFEFDDHTIEVSDGEAADIESTLTTRERRGVERYGWTIEQIAWRRVILHTDCGGDERMLDVHYPEDPESCWLASGSPRFDSDGLLAITKLAEIDMMPRYGWLSKNTTGSAIWSERAENEAGLMLFEPPKEGCRYILAVDPATGGSYTKGADPDCHGVFVIRSAYKNEYGNEYPIKVAMMAKPPCRWDTDILAKTVENMSNYYGNCLVVPERNMGIALIEALKDTEVPLYHEEVVDHLTSKWKQIYGWSTTTENRHRCIERLAALIRQSTVERPELLIPSSTVAECRTFVVDAKGKAAAASGRHDDQVMALAIGITCIDSATTLKPFIRRTRKPADRKDWKPAIIR